ncbi:MAG: hypothetical protein ACTHLW_12645 [Verrucomicrobiota bacterium]
MQVPFGVLSAAGVRNGLILAALPLLLVTGCRVVQNTAELPGRTVSMVANGGKTKPPALDPMEVQQTVLRFAGEFSSAMLIGVDKLRRDTKPLDPAEALQWKSGLDSETCSIASGPNAYANLLDLTVFVTVARSAIEEHWLPHVFGESARPLLESWRGIETNLWTFTGKVLTPMQQTELRTAIQNWRRQNSEPENVLAARAVGFASQIAGANNSDPAKPGSVFNLLMLDPLAGMDPAVREIAQSRMFAERALYVTQKMPRLVRWQTELLSLNAVRLPAVQQVVSNSAQLTSSVETFAHVADQLPKLVNDQREAAIKQIFDGLATERTNLIASLAADEMNLHGTLAELRQTLNAGTELAKSSGELLQSLDVFMVHFDQGTNAPAPSTNTNAPPFNILDYAATAKEMTATIRELNAAINSLDKATPQIQQAGAKLESAGHRLLNRLFWIGAGLIALLFAGTLVLRSYSRRFAR